MSEFGRNLVTALQVALVTATVVAVVIGTVIVLHWSGRLRRTHQAIIFTLLVFAWICIVALIKTLLDPAGS